MKELLDRFNSFFEGTASAEIIGTSLEITIGSQTLLISLPEIVGGHATGKEKGTRNTKETSGDV